MTAATPIPRAEYQAIPVFIQGRNIEPQEILIQELMAGDIADSMDDLFAVLGALMEQVKEKKLKSLGELDIDAQRLLIIKPVREAFFNIAGRAASLEAKTLRQVDTNSLLAVVAATVKVNEVFFSMLPGLLGLTPSAGKSSAKLSAAASPSP